MVHKAESFLVSLVLSLSPALTHAGVCDPNQVIDRDSQEMPLKPAFVFQHRPGSLAAPMELEVLDNKSGKTLDARIVTGPLTSDWYSFYRPVKPLAPHRSYTLRAKRNPALTMLLFRTTKSKRKWPVAQPRSPKLVRASRIKSLESTSLRLTLRWAKAVRGPMKVVIKSKRGLSILAAEKVGPSTYDVQPQCGPSTLDLNSKSQAIQVALLGPTGKMSAFYKLIVKPGD